MRKSYFLDLLENLSEKSKWAALGGLHYKNVPLQRNLDAHFSQSMGEMGSFLSDPTFEAVFGWETGSLTMEELSGNLLHADLLAAMDTPPKELWEYRFSKNQKPYTHQIESWRRLREGSPQSIVISSGTGSGKTECFMVPILDRLSRLREEKKGRLVGVRALFLYPLNALINSQRDRLRAWTEDYAGDIRFCLYNGNTPEKMSEGDRKRSQSETIDRRSLRELPPPILLTNPTMLEYMLIRTIDQPILSQSQGKLEYIVLDEAHTYIGSQAAELALLIRRVLFAFGVRPEDVRFIATSATLGKIQSEVGENLSRFLSDVAGVPVESVHVIGGERSVPPIPPDHPLGREPIEALFLIEEDAEISRRRYEALSKNMTARKIREIFVRNPSKPVARLSEVCRILDPTAQGEPSWESQKKALAWLDLLSGTQDEDGTTFLPLRAHLFHKTLPGLWSCSDPACSKRKGSELDTENWYYGIVYFEPRKYCLCGAPVYEIVFCDECEEVYLKGEIIDGALLQSQTGLIVDEFELEHLEGEAENPEKSDESTFKNSVLIINRIPVNPQGSIGPIDIDHATRLITEDGQGTLRLLVREDAGDGLACPVCGASESRNRRKDLFQSARLGAPFFLGTILPLMLEYAPDGTDPINHPYRGHRILTFNDSRQGTARIAAKLQQESERSRIRSLIYHILLAQGRSRSTEESEKLRREIESLRPHQEDSKILDMIRQKEEELANSLGIQSTPFEKLAGDIAGQASDFERMLRFYQEKDPDLFSGASGNIRLAQMFLLREFGRRPKRQNNLETMGMVAIRYPKIEKLKASDIPNDIKNHTDFVLEDWKNFLTLCMDFFIRPNGGLQIDDRLLCWLGIPYRKRFLISSKEPHSQWNTINWPIVSKNHRQRNIVSCLGKVLRADLESSEGRDRVDLVFQAAWETFREIQLFTTYNDGYSVLLNQLFFAPIEHVWVCPITRRFLNTTLKGITPYLPEKFPLEQGLCSRVSIPLYDKPFGGVFSDLERVFLGRQWISDKKELKDLREEGLWSDLNDRVIEMAPFFIAAEHSAQQDSRSLDRYERGFKAGDVNLLSCSTTMEMGIDIGGITLVGMNNVPPHPANYLQRAGRAGRRGEGRSLVLTLAKPNPHDQMVFRNTRWAFDSPLPFPRVSLDSPIIVQRHLNAFFLTVFLSTMVKEQSQDKTKLTCGWFFKGMTPEPYESFLSWCQSPSFQMESEIKSGIERLVRFSVLDKENPSRLAKEAAKMLEKIAKEWIAEWSSLNQQLADIAGKESSDPALKAIKFQQGRLEGEYLLRELASEGFLPGYGFPTDIVSFDNLTVSRLKAWSSHSDDGQKREDNRYRRRELPSRDRMTALRDYAPGSEVVIDGLVYESAGITLNWHLPPDTLDAREIQNIRFAWRCAQCGASGSDVTLQMAFACHECGKQIKRENIQEFLEPAGFAVDFYKDPTNDLSVRNFIPVESPWISANGQWFPLSNPDLGRFRTTTRGHVFYQSMGIHQAGYAICLSCGRTEPMLDKNKPPKSLKESHRKLRGRKGAPVCDGTQNSWKIKEGISLAHETMTDVLEIQLRGEEDGLWLNDEMTARTLSVVFRDTIADLLGVQTSELGCTVKESRQNGNIRCRSILIYDVYASGYVSSAENYIDRIFLAARRRLSCPVGCDSACPQCILDFDQRFLADVLDRNRALNFLTERWIGRLSIPSNLKFFGDNSRPEYRELTNAIFRESGKPDSVDVTLFAGGPPESWDLGPSPLRHLAYRLAGNDRNVSILLSLKSLESLEEGDRLMLSSLLDCPNIKLYLTSDSPSVLGGRLLAEVSGHGRFMRWASNDSGSFLLGPSWGKSLHQVIWGINETPLSNKLWKDLKKEDLLPKTANIPEMSMEIHHELDGPARGFGNRFWSALLERNSQLKKLFAQNKKIIEIRYMDRYLFSPLSVILLSEIIHGAKATFGQLIWGNPLICVTTSSSHGREGKPPYRVWDDWEVDDSRDRVLKAILADISPNVQVKLEEKARLRHARTFEVVFESGSMVLVLDQGVSYWRVNRTGATGKNISWIFDFSSDLQNQVQSLLSNNLNLEGAVYPTLIYVMAGGLTKF